MAYLNNKKINITASNIEKALTFLTTQVAPIFSTSGTYAVDDFVIYDGLLYQCITAITSSGAWDSTKWQLQKMFDNDGYIILKSGDIPDNHSVLDNILNTGGLYDIDSETTVATHQNLIWE